MNQEKIGKFIAELRKEKNMTQQELADRLGITDRAVSNWENGRRLPDLSMITILAKELNVEVSELLNAKKMSKEELEILRDTINNTLLYSENEKNNKKEKINEEPYKNEIKELKNDDEFVKKIIRSKKDFNRRYYQFFGGEYNRYRNA